MSAINAIAGMRREHIRQTGKQPSHLDVGRDMLRQIAVEAHGIGPMRMADGRIHKDAPEYAVIASVFDAARKGEFYLFGIPVNLVEEPHGNSR